MARYFQYLNLRTFENAYESLTTGLKERCTYDVYVQSQNNGLCYKVKDMVRNKINDENAEVIATVMVTSEDGTNPQIVEIKFIMKKENKKWKIDSYDYHKKESPPTSSSGK